MSLQPLDGLFTHSAYSEQGHSYFKFCLQLPSFSTSSMPVTAPFLSINPCQPTTARRFWGQSKWLCSNSTICKQYSVFPTKPPHWLHTRLKIYHQKTRRHPPSSPDSTPGLAPCSHCKTGSKGSKSQKK